MSNLSKVQTGVSQVTEYLQRLGGGTRVRTMVLFLPNSCHFPKTIPYYRHLNLSYVFSVPFPGSVLEFDWNACFGS